MCIPWYGGYVWPEGPAIIWPLYPLRDDVPLEWESFDCQQNSTASRHDNSRLYRLPEGRDPVYEPRKKMVSIAHVSRNDQTSIYLGVAG